MRLEFHPATQRDVNEILAFYEQEGSKALADRFFAAMTLQLSRVAGHPGRYSAYPPKPKFRRAFIPQFPHIILFRMRGGIPRITVIKHQRRHPHRGLNRS